jgi:hypothetical protein
MFVKGSIQGGQLTEKGWSMGKKQKPAQAGWRWIFKLRHWRPKLVVTFVTTITKRNRASLARR